MKLVHKAFAPPTPAGRAGRRLAALLSAFAALLALHGLAVAGGSACADDHCIDGRPVNVHAAAGATWAIAEPSPGTYRFELRPGDRWSGDRGAARERAELSFDEVPVRFGVLYRVSYEMRIEGTAPVRSQWMAAGQWHATEDAGDAASSPPLGLSLEGRDLIVFTQSEGAAQHTKNPPAVVRARVRNIARNRWIPVSYDVRFDWRRGWLAVTIGGRRLFAGEIPIGYNDAVGPYFKFGIYRAPTPQTLVLQYRNLTIREVGH